MKKKIETALSLTINDLTEKQKIFAFRLLLLLLGRQITPFQFNIMILKKLGYKPKRNELQKHFFVVAAENMSLLFKVKDNEIVLDYDFKENPFSKLTKLKHNHTPTFTRNYTIDTNITARQFADCLDYWREFVNSNADTNDKETFEVRLYFLAKIVETLYKINFETAKKMPFEILFAIQMWFAGIYMFFHKHDIYGILFQSSGESENQSNKITLGMSETLLHLQKEGYNHAEDMNIIDFFNAQIKNLKDNLSDAIAKGAKPAELAAQMKLEIEIINRLV